MSRCVSSTTKLRDEPSSPNSCTTGWLKRRRASSTDSAIAINMPCKTPNASTATTAPTTSIRSRFMRQTSSKGWGFRACHSALITATASTGRGSSCKAGKATASTTAITASATTPAQRLVAPAAALAEVAENPAPTGMPCSSAEATLQAPSTISSRFASSASPCAKAMLRMLPHDSANTSTTSPTASSPICSHCLSGRSGSPSCRDGRATAPTSSTPNDFKSNRWAETMASTMTTIDAGTCGQRFKPATATAATIATAIVDPCHDCTCVAAYSSTRRGSAPTPCGSAKPIASGNCLITMVMANANAKPRSTGRDTNDDNCPWRANASNINTTPASSTKASRAWA